MRAWLEVNLDILGENYQLVRNKIGAGVDIMAVVKADAYGHGIDRISKELDLLGVDSFAVISLDEARRVRRQSARPVLIMGYLDQKEIAEAIEEDFILSLYDRELIVFYERTASRIGKLARVHLKMETGLNRLGIEIDEAADVLTGQHRFPHVSIEAIFSHLTEATDRDSNLEQLRRLQQLLVKTQGRTPLLPIHFVSSGSLENFPEGRMDAVRVGLALYGVDEALPGTKPTLTCKSVIIQVKEVVAGEGVSYSRLFVADKPTTIAVVSIGYAEGYTQALTGRAEVLVKGKRVKVLGKISMNLISIDVTDLPVRRGDEVVLLGSQKDELGHVATVSANELAKWSNLRHHEIITRMGTALPRVYIGGKLDG
ncbi:MAG: alanine racemase [Patescibacteria group bacterium]